MEKIIISTTFRDFDGSVNDKMQIGFLKSLKGQTFQNFRLVVTVFGEKKVEKVAKGILGDKVFFIHDNGSEKYKFSISKTFMNGVDYGLTNGAAILVDCSSDIVLQSNFLNVVNKRIGSGSAGISHPNVFCEENENDRMYFWGKISQGIDVRFYSLDLFKQKHVYDLLNRFPSYDYGASVEMVLCGIAIKYAVKRYNIFMESKVLKRENVRDGQVGVETDFMRAGCRKNLPTVKRFIRSEGISEKYLNLPAINRAYKITRLGGAYRFMFGEQLLKYYWDGCKQRINLQRYLAFTKSKKYVKE